MKLLFENWRKYLLTEAAMTVDDLMGEKAVDLYIMARPSFGEGIEFVYASADRRGEPYALDYPKHAVSGEILITPAGSEEIDGPCDNAWQVKFASAVDKWGPLLYDVAMEYATLMGGGLVSDRTVVSDEAYAVWDYYLKSRSDVIKSQTDNEEGELTPDNKQDDCLQNSTFDHVNKTNGEWTQNPLSKLYRKDNTTISALGDRLVTIGFERWQLGG